MGSSGRGVSEQRLGLASLLLLCLLLISGGFDIAAQSQSERQLDQPDSAVSKKDGPARGDKRPSVLCLERADGPAADQLAKGSARAADQRVPGKDIGEVLMRRQMGEGGLLDGAEGADLIPTARELIPRPQSPNPQQPPQNKHTSD